MPVESTRCFGSACRLPDGQMGNSRGRTHEHRCGARGLQDLPRIDDAVKSGELADNTALKEFIDTLNGSGGTCHLLGLLSPGGVHSHQSHMATLANIVAAAGVPVAVHALLDGRDTPPKSAPGYLEHFLNEIDDTRLIRIVSLCGRYYAMDRDKRWDRVEIAYRAS